MRIVISSDITFSTSEEWINEFTNTVSQIVHDNKQLPSHIREKEVEVYIQPGVQIDSSGIGALLHLQNLNLQYFNLHKTKIINLDSLHVTAFRLAKLTEKFELLEG